MAIDWDKIAREAGEETDEHFKNKISSLTRLNDNEIEFLVTETGISNKDMANLLKEVKDATKSNSEKAAAISNINLGVEFLVGVASKLL